MMTPSNRSWTTALLCLGLFIAACGGEKKADTQASIAKAVAAVGEKPLHGEEASKAAAALKDRAKKQAEEAREKALAEAIVLPAAMPANLGDACKQVAAAYDSFRTAKKTDVEAQKWAHLKKTELTRLEEDCKKGPSSLQATACLVQVLTHPPLVAVDGDEDELKKRCDAKFGGAQVAQTP